MASLTRSWGSSRRSWRLAAAVTAMTVASALAILTSRAMAAGTMRDLGSLQSGCGSTAVAINDHAQIAGTSCGEPFRWTPAKGMQGLGGLSSADDGAAAAISSTGAVTGWSDISAGEAQHAFVWTPSGGMQDLTPGNVEAYSFGQAINASGEVAFTWLHYDSTRSGELWTKSQGSQDVGSLGGTVTDVGIGPAGYQQISGCCVSAQALNNLGDLTGGSEVPTDGNVPVHAYLDTPSGGMQDLGTLPGDAQSVGVAVNNSMDVAGNSQDADGVSHAFVWTPTAGMQELMLPTGTSSDAVAINNQGKVVGYSELANGNVDAFLWSPGHPIRDLGQGQAVAINKTGQVAIAGTSGGVYRWTSSKGTQYIAPGTPTAMNDSGQITGDGTDGDAFLWTP
jgi:probable HAF family extracellular repeat protein